MLNVQEGILNVEISSKIYWINSWHLLTLAGEIMIISRNILFLWFCKHSNSENLWLGRFSRGAVIVWVVIWSPMCTFLSVLSRVRAEVTPITACTVCNALYRCTVAHYRALYTTSFTPHLWWFTGPEIVVTSNRPRLLGSGPLSQHQPPVSLSPPTLS